MTGRTFTHLLLAMFFILSINSRMIAQEATQEATPLTGLTIYVVQRGDNLFRIALAHGITTQQLADLNGVTNVNNIQVGQRLLVPADNSGTPDTQTHTIQAGETLSSIAALYGIPLQTLMSVNNITDPGTIYAGQELSISVQATITPSDTPLPNPTATESASDSDSDTADTDASTSNVSGARLHTVAAGETLYRIALAHNVTVNDLAQANSISDPTRIFAGQQLIIPGTGSTTVALDLPAPLVNLTLKPLIFTEGKTGSIRLTLEAGATVSGTFMDQDLRLMALPQDNSYVALVGIPRFTESGIYPVNLTMTDAAGSSVTHTFNIQVRAGAYGAQSLNLSQDRITLLAPAAQDYEIDLLTTITASATTEKFFAGPLSIPAAAAMNSPFGTYRNYNNGTFTGYHTGADFASAPGTPIFAAADGRVVLADLLNIRGNAIVIDHGWGVYSTYSHQSELLVTLGEMVQTGEVIGRAGATGRITGPHLHWEVWVNGVAVDPLQWTQTTFP